MEKIRMLLRKVEVLSPSPAVLVKLLPSLNDVDADFDEVVRLISMEQSLTAKLLQISNSSFFGQPEPVATVAEAVNRVGYQSVYLLVAMISGKNCFPTPSPRGIDSGKLWQHSLATAFNAKFVAESAGQDGNLLFTAGLLHDIGKLVMVQSQLPMPLQVIGNAFHQPTNAAAIEREIMLFGFTHSEAGASLLEKWNLPASLVASVRHHHDPLAAHDFAPIAASVSLGNQISHLEHHPRLTESPEFKNALSQLGLDGSELEHWRKRFHDSRDLIESMNKLP